MSSAFNIPAGYWLAPKALPTGGGLLAKLEARGVSYATVNRVWPILREVWESQAPPVDAVPGEPVAWEVLTLGEWRPTRFPDELRAKGFEVRAAPSTLRQPEAAGQAKPRDRQPMGKQAKELERLARAWVYAAIRSVEQKAPNYVSDHEEACELAFRAAIVAIEPIVRERAASLVGSEGMVLVPRELLQAASESLGSFVSDHGWSQHDMDVMDSIDAVLAARASAGEAQS